MDREDIFWTVLIYNVKYMLTILFPKIYVQIQNVNKVSWDRVMDGLKYQMVPVHNKNKDLFVL